MSPSLLRRKRVPDGNVLGTNSDLSTEGRNVGKQLEWLVGEKHPFTATLRIFEAESGGKRAASLSSPVSQRKHFAQNLSFSPPLTKAYRPSWRTPNRRRIFREFHNVCSCPPPPPSRPRAGLLPFKNGMNYSENVRLSWPLPPFIKGTKERRKAVKTFVEICIIMSKSRPSRRRRRRWAPSDYCYSPILFLLSPYRPTTATFAILLHFSSAKVGEDRMRMGKERE